MIESGIKPIIAVDGGGTSCRLAFHDGALRHVAEVGPANVTSDFEGAIARLTDGLNDLAAGIGLPVETLRAVPAYLGLAGVTGERIAKRVAASLPLDNAHVEDDRHPALAGAHGFFDGAIAHCGTGSFLALQSAGSRRFAGGWGPVLGDTASAQWVGRRALSLTLDACDGLAAETALTATLLEDFGGTDRIVGFASGAAPHELGRIARKVTDAAGSGDGMAISLMREASGHLLQSLEQMGWTPAMPLCLTGGIGPHYEPYLPDHARQAVVPPRGTPLDGAISLARTFLLEETV